MRIPSGVTDQYIYFVAVDETDLKTRETGLSSFTVYRDRNGNGAVAMTTPTVTEVDSSNMSGVYKLLLDEDMSIGSGNDSEEMVFHITHSGIAPITRVIELYRPKITAGYTLGIGSDGDLLEVNTLTGHTAQTGDTYAELPTNFSSLVISTAGVANTNIKLISDDADAADNLEATYDGTGYLNEYAPAQQQQLDNLAIGSAGLSVVASSVTVTTGTPTGSYTNTHEADGVYHQYADDAGVIDTYYEFDIGGNGVPSTITGIGRATGLNDPIGVYGYNWGTTSWEQIGTVPGGNADVERTFSLYTSHVGTGVNIGKVRVRFYNTGLTTAIFYIDQMFVTYSNVSQSVGYANGAIWIDTINGSSGTVTYVNGTADNPSDSLANALTIASNIGLNKFEIAPASSITLAATTINKVFNCNGSSVALGGQQIGNCTFSHLQLSGIASNAGIGGILFFEYASIGNVTIPSCFLNQCAFTGTITLADASIYIFDDCSSATTGGSDPIIDFGAAVGSSNVNLRHFSGRIDLQNMGQSGTDAVCIEGKGSIVVNANCIGGSICLSGNFDLTDNSGGAVTITKEALYNKTEVLDSITDDDTKIDGSALNTLSSHDPGATIGTADAGDAMTLEDDAITSAKFDESTAFPIKSADTGATEIARTGADGDTLEDLSDQLDTINTSTGTTIPNLINALNDIAASDVWDVASALTTDFGTLLERLYQWFNNRETITDTTGAVTLRNVGNTADLASWSITDNDTTTTRTEITWA